MNKAISYVRYSSKEQSKGDSYRRQLKAAEEYCKKHGLELDETIVDSGVSAYRGTNAKVGALARILEDVETGRIPRGTTLIIESLDRLSRMEVEKALRLLLDVVDEKELVVVTLSDEKTYRKGQLDMITLMTSLLVMSRANEESAMKSRRLSAVWGQKKQQATEGKIVTSQIPSWLKLVDNKFKVIEERAESIRKAFEVLSKGHGITYTVRYLNERGVPSHTGKVWARTSLKRLVTEQTVIGHYQPYTKSGGTRRPSGELIRNYYPTVVDEDVFWAVNHKYKTNGGSNAERKGQLGNLFSGRAICSMCGSKMRYYNKGGENGRYLACRGRVEGHGCNLPFVQYGQVEQVVLMWLHYEGVKLIEPESNGVSLDAIRAKLEDNAQAQERLFDMIERTGSSDTLDERFKRLRQEANELKAQLSERPIEEQTQQGIQRLIEEATSDTGRMNLARQIKRLGLSLTLGKDLIEINGKVKFERTYERGYWRWLGTNGQSIIFYMKGYDQRIKGLRQNWGNKPEGKGSSLVEGWKKMSSYPSHLRLFEELDDDGHMIIEEGDEFFLGEEDV